MKIRIEGVATLKDMPMDILLVESNHEDAQRIQKALADDKVLSGRTQVATCLAQSLDALSVSPFDLVLLDLALSDSSGLPTLEKVMARAGDIPVIVLSNNGAATLAADAVRQGAMAILSKRIVNSARLSTSICFAVQRHKREHALRFKEKKFRSIIDSLKDAFLEIDLAGVFTYANDAGVVYLGRPRHEIIGSNSLDYNHTEEQRQRNIKVYTEVLQTGRTGVLASTLTRPDGSLITIEHRASLVFNDRGKPVGFRGITRDVSEQFAIQKAVEASKEKYQMILESLEDTYFEVDLKGRMLYFNRTEEGLYGYSLEELQRLDNRAYMDEENARKVVEAYREIYKTGEPKKNLQYEVVYRNGAHFFVESSIGLMRDEAGRPIGFRGVGRDITWRKEKELELIQAKEKAEAATRAKSEFLANMSHEIRTPMNGILGMYTLLQGTTLDGEQSGYVNIGKQCADGLLTLINDILDFSKIEAGKLALESIDFNLRATIEDMLAWPASQAQAKGLEFIYHIDPAVPSLLMGDPGRLRQILLNLIVNAVKFTQKGEVGLWVTLEGEEPGAAALRFSVKDTGIGISSAEQSRLFQSFQQVDTSSTRKYGGAGLGLVIARRLTELMGGKMGVKSAVGRGSTFWFTIKLTKSPGDSERPLASPEVLRGKRILIVDDNQTNLAILEGLLKRWGCDCDRASSAAMALSLMKATAKAGACYQLVITDMLMPKMDGAELGRRIKADPDLKAALLVMLTSMGMRGDAAEMKRIGFAAYLTKPVRPDQLYDCLLSVIGAEQTPQRESQPARLVTSHTLTEDKRRRMRILLAEDNAINQKFALHLLGRLGFQTDAVLSGKAAIEALATKAYDLVLMDVEMPEMDGFEATAVIRDPVSAVLDHGVPVIAMTARATNEDRKECLAAGMDDYIAKPLRPDELLHVVEKQIGARQN
ncbi:MAG: response regulator [Desulfobacteraceae bacterium]|nr:response regulator [Desulfobacteraceae bacterium]